MKRRAFFQSATGAAVAPFVASRALADDASDDAAPPTNQDSLQIESIEPVGGQTL